GADGRVSLGRAANGGDWARAAPATARPGPTATAAMVRPDCRLSTARLSPTAAEPWARPVMLSWTPSASKATRTMSLRLMTRSARAARSWAVREIAGEAGASAAATTGAAGAVDAAPALRTTTRR